MRQSRQLSDSHWQRAIDNYKHYFGRLDAGNVDENAYPFYSKMSASISYEVVETVMPRIIGKDPEFTCLAQEPSDVASEETAKLVLQTQYNNPKLELLGEPIYLKLQRMVKEALITGNAVGRPMWRRQSRQMVKYVASLERAGLKEADIMKVVETAQKLGKEDEIKYGKQFAESPFLDDFDISHKPFYHYFPDAVMIEPGRMRFQIERELMDFEELSDEGKRFGYNASEMAEIQTAFNNKSAFFNPASDGAVSKNFMFEYQDLFAISDQRAFATDDEKIPLLQVDKMWTNDGKVHVFVNEKWQLTPEAGLENPYDIKKPPFIHIHDVVIPHSYYSRGEIDAIKKLEDGANDLMNMRFDNLLQSMLNYWLYNPKLMANGDDFVAIPNSSTAVKDVDKAVRVITGQDVTPNAYNEANILADLIKSISGTKDNVQGGEEGVSPAGRTYGGMRMAQEMANARFVVKSRLFEKVTLKALGYFILEFSRQFMSKDRVTRMAGDMGTVEEKKISVAKLKSIVGFMDMQVVPNSAQSQDVQAEAMRLNAMADRFQTAQGAFKDIPNEVYDKFLLKYFTANGIADAVYWVRAISEARSGKEKGGTVTPKEGVEAVGQANGSTPPAGGAPALPPQLAQALATATQPQPTLPQAQPGLPTVGLPLPSQPVLQSDQIAMQPDPLAQLLQAQGLTPAM